MNYIYLCLCISIFLGFACNHVLPTTMENKHTENPDNTGYWAIPKDKRVIKNNDGSIHFASLPIFHYDGKNITLQLFTEKEWMWKRPDDFYCLQSQWQGDSLMYLPPFGRWEFLARFDGRHFYRENHQYQRISADQIIAPEDKDILNLRPVHDYNIKPLDPRE